MKKTKANLKNATIIAKDIAYSAGEKLKYHRARLKNLKVSSKKALGVVSNADVESEKLITKALKKSFPETEILAEEEAYKKFKGKAEAYSFFKDQEWTWIVDPLDGTSNFLSGLDIFAVCIGLVHYGKPVVGVVYNPMTGECYSATEGEGAWLENLETGSKRQRLKVSTKNKKLSESMLATGFATEKGQVFDIEFNQFKSMMAQCRAVRRMGSAAIDLCYVAKGTFDGFWERGLAPWDVAAAGCICKEAGIKITDYHGNAFHPFQETIVAAKASLHKQICGVF